MEFEAVTGINDDLIREALAASTTAREVPGVEFYYESAGPNVFFSFPASYSVSDWLDPANNSSFGGIKLKRSQFPSLRSFGNNEDATVNEAFFKKAEAVFSKNSSFQEQVKMAVQQGKRLVFTGQSSGGATAILVTVWFLESYGPTLLTPCCITFGAPLVGDAVFKHALGRENWSQYFVHFVTRYDLIPRVMFAPKSSLEQSLHLFLHHLDPHTVVTPRPGSEQMLKDFYTTVMRNTSCVASQIACKLMGNTNPLLETLSSFVDRSPYRPFGTYIFCPSERPVVVKNADAILQILFYSSQSSEQRDWPLVLFQSIQDHHKYGTIREFLRTNLFYHLDQLSLSSDGSDFNANSIGGAVNDLGLSINGRLCVRAAIGAEIQRYENQEKIQRRQGEIAEKLNWIERQYKTKCEAYRIGYFDSFKASKEEYDFEANVNRAELAGIFDEVLGLLRMYQLPDGFEGCEEWIALATKYRRLVEPLDIANYYRHLKNEDTGPYMDKGRPSRYKYAQKWFEHKLWKQTRTKLEDTFWTKVNALNLGSPQDIKKNLELSGSECGSSIWAEVEELRGKPYQELWVRIRTLETMISTWIDLGDLDMQIFLEGSTFSKWWNTLPEHHRIQSPVSRHIHG